MGEQIDVPAESWLSDAVVVRSSPIQGRGLFANRPISRGVAVEILGGQTLTTAEVKDMIGRSERYDGISLAPDLNLQLVPADWPGIYGNHSCDPNLWMQDAVTVVARRDIAAGEELTCDYALYTTDPAWSMKCNCGTALCRGQVTGGDWKQADLQERYRRHFVPAVQELIDAEHPESAAPTADVLAAFGVSESPSRLEGGQGETYRAGDLILKPVDDEIEADWAADLFAKVTENGFRVARPVSTGSSWLHRGWSAWRFIEGDHDLKGHWEEKLIVGRAFHKALADVPKPAFLEQADSIYRRADRMAWGEIPLDSHAAFADPLDRLASLKRPVDLRSQLIHGDLDGNVLFHDGLPPAIIDFAPYWRPVEYASAIVVADALDWGGADKSFLQAVSDIPQFDQLLIRAEMFRIGIWDGLAHQGTDRSTDLDPHLETIQLLEQRVAAGM